MGSQDVGESPPDPFAGMTPAERKRAQETAILEMAYDLRQFSAVEPGERPDFSLRRNDAGRPFGVEVTQIFPSEAHARLNLVPGYMQRLWSGGEHLHKQDVKVLQATTVEVRDKEGNVKHPNVPGVITQTPSLQDFRAALARALRDKAAKGYDVDHLAHVDLVILDWFHLPFQPREYLTDRFFDDEVRRALQESPFREVFLVLEDWGEGAGDDGEGEEPEPTTAARWKIPLQQLLIMERAFATGHVIDEEYGANLRDVAHLNALMVDHVSRVQGYGEPVLSEGRLFLRYRATLVEITENGLQVRAHQDFEVPAVEAASPEERMDPESEARVSGRAATLVFGTSHAEAANVPSTWDV